MGMTSDVRNGFGEGAEVRVAVVGAGSMAREHIRAFRDLPGAVVAGIHSRTRTRAEALASEFDIEIVADSIAELHERTAADLVVVAVPELSACRVAEACFQHPWTALLEKPAGFDLADAQAIAAAAAAGGRRVLVALNRRFYSATRAVLDDLATLDGPRFIQVQDQQDPVAAAAAGQPPEVVRNWMFANSVHTIDFLRVMGRGSIVAVDPILPWNPDAPGPVVARVRFDSGDEGVYEGMWNAPGPWAVAVTTAQRRWEQRPLEVARFQRRGEYRQTELERDAVDLDFKAGFRRQAEEAAAAALGRPSASVSLQDSLDTMRLVHRIFFGARGAGEAPIPASDPAHLAAPAGS